MSSPQSSDDRTSKKSVSSSPPSLEPSPTKSKDETLSAESEEGAEGGICNPLHCEDDEDLETFAFIDDYIAVSLRDRDFMWTGCCLERAVRHFDTPFYKKIRELSRDYRMVFPKKFSKVSVRLLRNSKTLTQYIWTFCDALFEPGFTYPRMTALLSFSGELAYYCVFKRHIELIADICTAVSSYVLGRLFADVMDTGGWATYVQTISPDKVYYRCIPGRVNFIASSRSGLLEVQVLSEGNDNNDDDSGEDNSGSTLRS